MTSFLDSIEFPRVEPRIWSEPESWEQSRRSSDDRKWIEAMAVLGLHSKACSAFECGDYYVPILVCQDHYVKLGRTSCQCKTCRDCGTGAMRVHRMYLSNPGRVQLMTSESCRTFRLVVHFSSAAESLADYMARIHQTRFMLVYWRSRMRKKFKKDWGYTCTPEFDTRLKDVIWRVYYVGRDPGHPWFAAEWQKAAGTQSHCDSRRHSHHEAKDALRYVMDGIQAILELPGPERAAWEYAMQGYRFTSSVGSLRGVEVDSHPEVPDSGDPEAPYGRCPCGCQGILVRPDIHHAEPKSFYQEKFKIIEVGAIKTYTPYRSKVSALASDEYRISPASPSVAPSPPPWVSIQQGFPTRSQVLHKQESRECPYPTQYPQN